MFPSLASIKYDGVFGFALPDGRIFSRTGKQCTSLPHKSDKIVERGTPKGLSDHVLIFEVYVEGWPVQDISGAFRRHFECFEAAELYIHDAIPFQDFVAGDCPTPFKYRTTIAKVYAELLEEPYIDNVLLDTEEQAVDMAAELIDAGCEGIILRDPNAGWYAGKRNAYLTKIKQEETYDLEVVGVTEGKGKYKGTLGSLTVRFNGGTQEISGMTDRDRNAWWTVPEIIVGKIVEVQCMCLTTDGWMREPRYKMVRTDKSTPDA